MSAAARISGIFQGVLERPAGGVVGLVDDLMRLCQEHGLQLDWQAASCRVCSLTDGWEEVIDRPLRKSAFRALLARVAALCNERNPDSVSPYGGQGELAIGPDPAAVFRVSFANTPDEQWLQLVRVGSGPEERPNGRPTS
jgi:hypothetical protein